ncbi:siderophore-interacting protein [Nocardia sp. NPDC003345]
MKAAIRQRAQGDRLLSLRVRVAGVEQLSPGFTRVVLEGSELSEYRDPRPADAFKIMLPPDPETAVETPVRGANGLPEWPGGVQPLLRAFTVRTFDPATNRLTMDVAEHDAGLSLTWLRAVRPGEAVWLAGMRPEWAVAAGVRDHVLVGDGTALPAIAAILEGLDPDHTVSAYVALPDPADLELVPSHPNLTVRLLPAVADVTGHLPLSFAVGRRTQVWIAAEAAEVRRVRSHAVEVWGVDRADMLARAYWKRGSTNTEVDAVARVRYEKALAEGGSAYDPELAEAIDLAV